MINYLLIDESLAYQPENFQYNKFQSRIVTQSKEVTIVSTPYGNTSLDKLIKLF